MTACVKEVETGAQWIRKDENQIVFVDVFVSFTLPHLSYVIDCCNQAVNTDLDKFNHSIDIMRCQYGFITN